MERTCVRYCRDTKKHNCNLPTNEKIGYLFSSEKTINLDGRKK